MDRYVKSVLKLDEFTLDVEVDWLYIYIKTVLELDEFAMKQG